MTTTQTFRGAVLLASTCLLFAGQATAQECDEEAMLALDRDNDELPDIIERFLGTDPDRPDTDGDGILDGPEVDPLGTNPHNVDTDGDGWCDGGIDREPVCTAGEDLNNDGLIDVEQDETDPVCTFNGDRPTTEVSTVRGSTLMSCGASGADDVPLCALFVVAAAWRWRRRALVR